MSATIRSSVDRSGVKPLCCGPCFAKIVFFIRARHVWAKTLAGTDRSDIPRYLVRFYVEPFPFQSGRIMARFQSVGMTQYFQMSVKRGSSQLMAGAPPDLSSSAVIPQIPGATLFFSFRIAADISSDVGGVESTERSGVALAASATRTRSSGGAGLLNCSWKWSFHLWSWSVSSQSGDPSLAVTGGRLYAVRPVSAALRVWYGRALNFDAGQLNNVFTDVYCSDCQCHNFGTPPVVNIGQPAMVFVKARCFFG